MSQQSHCELCGSDALRVSDETGFLICDDCGTQSQARLLPDHHRMPASHTVHVSRHRMRRQGRPSLSNGRALLGFRVGDTLTRAQGAVSVEQNYTQEEVEDEMQGVNAHTGHRRRAKGHRVLYEEEEEEEEVSWRGVGQGGCRRATVTVRAWMMTRSAHARRGLGRRRWRSWTARSCDGTTSTRCSGWCSCSATRW
jgi:hypothetical protein